MKIGVFGGTFDPPHIGHLILAQESQYQLQLDRILWVLTPFPPHKTSEVISPVAHRSEMLKLAIENNRDFQFSTIDIDRVPPLYAVDTLQLLKDKAPKDEFHYLMGGDSLSELLTWHHPAEFVDICSGIVVMLRGNQELYVSKLEEAIPGLKKKAHYLQTPLIEISATDIRNRVKKGGNFRYFVPEKVYQYILKNELYLD
jgi:nicotinate-nucleotide adenylyltransferase